MRLYTVQTNVSHLNLYTSFNCFLLFRQTVRHSLDAALVGSCTDFSFTSGANDVTATIPIYTWERAAVARTRSNIASHHTSFLRSTGCRLMGMDFRDIQWCL